MRPAQSVFMGYHKLGTIVEPGASTGDVYQFRLNSVYDFDYTGSGTTSQGYVAMSTLYSLFRVKAVRLIIRMTLSTTGTAVVGFMSGLSSTVSANYTMLENMPNSYSRLVQGNVGGGHAVAEWDVTIDLAKVAGVTRAQYMTDFDFAHAAGANPAKTVYLTLFLSGNSGAAQTTIYHVRAIQDVECSQPLQTVIA